MITVQPIHYTSQPHGWHRLAAVLGFVAASPLEPGWSELDAGGVLAIHQIDAGDPRDGTTDLHLLVDDLGAAGSAARSAGARVEDTPLEGVGDMLTCSFGPVVLTVSQGARAALGDPSVLPIWYVPDTTVPASLFRALGLVPRVASDSEVWADFTAVGGGLVALHQGEPHTELAFEYAGDLDGLASRLDAAGFDSVIVDEAYNRTIRVTAPGVPELLINGVQQDLYGYHGGE